MSRPRFPTYRQPVTPGDTLPVDERCRRCGGPLAFVQTAKSAGTSDPKYFPLDPAPSANLGNVHLTAGTGGRLVGHVRVGLELEAHRRASDPLYVTHFATCPKGAPR